MYSLEPEGFKNNSRYVSVSIAYGILWFVATNVKPWKSGHKYTIMDIYLSKITLMNRFIWTQEQPWAR